MVKADYRVFHDYDKWYVYYKAGFGRNGEKLVTSYSGNLVMPKIIWMYYKTDNSPGLLRRGLIKGHKKGDTDYLYFNGGSLIPAVDLAIRLGKTDILLIADNKVYSDDFQRHSREAISKLKAYAKIYCFKADNNFNLPYKRLKDFLDHREV